MANAEWRTRLATIAQDAWELESGEDRRAKFGERFYLPEAAERSGLRPGQSVRLLFRIEGWDEEGNQPELGVERMWAIVAGRAGSAYVGILDNQPATITEGHLDRGDEFLFEAKHVIDIADPPPEYVREVYGDRVLFDEDDR